jgi:hypothetical protein
LAGLRFHDLRHHAITELAESQASDSTVMAIAGHVSQKMLQHYSHVRLQAKEGRREGCVTKHVIKHGSTEIAPAPVIENYGGASRDRTDDLIIANLTVCRFPACIFNSLEATLVHYWFNRKG